MARIITVTSGKGGVGKTSVGVNTAVALAAMGKKVCIFDADLGLANVNILLGLYPEFTLEDVVAGEKTLPEVIIRGRFGIDIIPGSTGVQKLANLDGSRLADLIRSFAELSDYDFLIVDTSAGVSRDVISFCMASAEVMLVLTPEPTSMTDGYALLKILAMNGYRHPVMVTVNQCARLKDAAIVFERFAATVGKFLPVKLVLLGPVQKDPLVGRAVLEQKPFVIQQSEALPSRCIRRIAELLVRRRGKDVSGFAAFLGAFLKAMRGPVRMPAKGGQVKTLRPETGAYRFGGPLGGGEAASPMPGPAPGETPDTAQGKTLETAAEEITNDAAPRMARDTGFPGEGASSVPGREIAGGPDESILAVMRRLEAKVDALGADLAEIRKSAAFAMEAFPALTESEPAPIAGEEREREEDPLRIALDFEAFVSRRKTANPQKNRE